ncbi:hypothetical protein WICPIJ_002088 [Wickerhamomyces pijperi]|uniref:Uncharacterized protein n=1 Tax=Wickerhamomyces pijperi TaxID=599730 RepID=A0A9P8Q9L5_WICPI|nr:hypothetical protein WICPIJ_002088 [Wickerhamomyces pijperi]
MTLEDIPEEPEAPRYTDRNSEVVLVVASEGSKFGGCCLDVAAKKLHLIEDIYGKDKFLLFCESLLLKLTPSKVSFSARIDVDVQNFLQEKSQANNYLADFASTKSFNMKQSLKIIDELMDDNGVLGNTIYPLLTELKSNKDLYMAVWPYLHLLNPTRMTT